jgi:hypothetical protein
MTNNGKREKRAICLYCQLIWRGWIGMDNGRYENKTRFFVLIILYFVVEQNWKS